MSVRLVPPRSEPPIARGAAAACAAWGLGFGLFAAAYFTRGNDLLPLRPGHAGLALAEILFYAALAGAAAAAASAVATLARAGRGARAAVALWTGPWVLFAALLATLYRERINAQPAGVAGMVATTAILAGAALLWLVAVRRSARGGERALRMGRRALVAIGLALAAVGAVSLATARLPSGPAPAGSASGSAREAAALPRADRTGLRVLVIGMDGGAWKVLDPLLRRGEMPRWAALADRGATAALKTDLPTFSPIIWTSIASGVPMARHGIMSHVRTRLPLPGLPWAPHNAYSFVAFTKAELAPLRLLERAGRLEMGMFGSGDVRARRLWDDAGELGLPSVVVSWYVTHPAPAIRGVVVSDLFHRAGDLPAELPRAVAPASLLTAIQPALTRPEDVPADFPFTLGLVDTTGLDAAGRAALLERWADRFTTVRQEMARDLTSAAAFGRACAAEPDWRLGMVYFRAMDNIHHLFWEERELPAGDLDRHPERRLRGAVDAYYRNFCEPLLAKALTTATADDSTVVIMLSDHGWEDARYGHNRAPDGFFIVAGGPGLRSASRGAISIYDVAPTVLALLGLPVPEDVTGHVARDLFDPAFWSAHPVRTVPTYGPPAAGAAGPAGAAAPLDEKAIRQLRALGYVH